MKKPKIVKDIDKEFKRGVDIREHPAITALKLKMKEIDEKVKKEKDY